MNFLRFFGFFFIISSILIVSFFGINKFSFSESVIEFTLSNNGIVSLTYNGQNYLPDSQFAGVLVTSALFETPEEDLMPYGWLSGALGNLELNGAVKSSGPDWVEQTYRNGQENSFTYRSEYTLVDSDTLKIDTYITNNDDENILRRISLGYNYFPLKIPGPAKEYQNNVPIVLSAFTHNGKPAQLLSGDWGSVAMWPHSYDNNSYLSSNYGSAGQLTFNWYLNNNYNAGGGVYNEDEILPGETWHYTFYVRFGPPNSVLTELAPEPLQNFASDFPFIINWTDRRPIARWFISEGSSRSSINPRGYLNNSSLDALNPSVFNNAILAKTDDIIARMDTMDPKPQGILVWDLEGQEFGHAFTYVGYPNKLPDIAPEMDNVADEMFEKFTLAGYKVGITIRPQTFLTGTELPETCEYRSGGTTRDVFVDTDGEFGARNYVCVSDNNWQVTSLSPGHQIDLSDNDEILDELRSKISYAYNRWGVTLFYIDSSVYPGGGPVLFTIFRQLQQEFPEVILFPEIENNYYYGASAPYGQYNMGHAWAPSGARNIWPQAFSLIQAIDGVNYLNPGTFNLMTRSVKAGNILFVDGWYSSAQNDRILSVYRYASSTHTISINSPSSGSTISENDWNPQVNWGGADVCQYAFEGESSWTTVDCQLGGGDILEPETFGSKLLIIRATNNGVEQGIVESGFIYSETEGEEESGIPSAPENFIENIGLKTQTGITLIWNISNGNGSTVTSYVVEHTLEGQDSWSQSSFVSSEICNIGEGVCTANISNLSSGQSYEFRVKAVNEEEIESDWSLTLTTYTATTPPPTSAPSVVTFSVSGITETSAIISGNIISSGTSNVTSRGFNFGTSISYGQTVEHTSGPYNPGSYSIEISNLLCGTTYHFRSFAINSVGVSTGNNYIFTTSSCPPPTEENNNENIQNTGGGGGTIVGLVGSTGSLLNSQTPRPQIINPDGTIIYLDEEPRSTSTQLQIQVQQGNILPKINFPYNLGQGMTDVYVRVLQKFLNSKGYLVSQSGPGSPGNETNYFGPATFSALARFQRENNIYPSSGYMGNLTRNFISNPLIDLASTTTQTSSITRNLTVGMEGDDVKLLQQILISHGYPIPAGVTGFFGEQTRSALSKYQSDNNIYPDVGYFGTVTNNHINSNKL